MIDARLLHCQVRGVRLAFVALGAGYSEKASNGYSNGVFTSQRKHSGLDWIPPVGASMSKMAETLPRFAC